MVGLSDIPIVGVAIKRISETTVNASIRGLRYTLCYRTLVNELKSEIEKVKIEEVLVSRKVRSARNDGKIIEKHVEEWQEKVQNMKTLAHELSGQRTSFTCFKHLAFPDLVSRFRLGRKAAHQSKSVANLTVSGKEIVTKEVGYLQPIDNVPTVKNTYQIFASREEAYGKLLEALGDENGDPILGIYGMPGVGKTRMVEQAWKDAKDNNIFDKVARVNVSEKFDVIGLQDKLAAVLDCHLESKDEMHRASQLKTSLMNGGKTLVILDDVWDVIPLNNVGIAFGGGNFMGCKILLTSRQQVVLLRNKCKSPIEIKTLKDDEAWEMFRYTVGNSKIETLSDTSLAEKVCKRCAALPILINAVGNALKFVTENLWSDALYQLENHKFEEIEGIEPEVYGCIQLSFGKLNVEARNCLLLCSLFPEDDDIEIKMLFDVATGSQLLDRERNIDAVIYILKSSSLLLHGKDNDTVKVHDIIRDVARSIARDPAHAFLCVRCTSRLPDNVDYPSLRLLKLDLQEDNVHFPVDLVCQDLHTLWLRSDGKKKQLSRGFPGGFTKVKFLLLQGMNFPHRKQLHIHRLEKLSVLVLQDCDIQETFLSSIWENLETLCFCKCKLPSLLDFSKLKNLRKLELLYNSFDVKIVGKAISSLSSLEELKILGRYTILYDAEADARSIFALISPLIRFRNLMIDFDYSQHYPNQDIMNKLVEFNIHVGSRHFGYVYRSLRSSAKKSITFEGNNIENGWMALVERAEQVELRGVSGLTNGLSNSNMRESFVNLRDLKINSCHQMKHVASWDQKNQQMASSFSNLTSVYIYNCRGLKYLFSAGVAKYLKQMQKLGVYSCSAIEEIVRVEEVRTDEGEIISFPKLKELHLQDLPNLTGIYSYKVASEVTELDNSSETRNHKQAYSFNQLTLLEVIDCDKLENVIPVMRVA